MKVLLAATLAIGCVLALSSCEQYGHGPAAIRDSGGGLELALCADVSVSELYVEYRGSRSAGFRELIEWTGSLEAARGLVLTTSVVPQGLDGAPGTFPGAAEEVVVVISSTSPSDGFTAAFTPRGQLSDVMWLQSTGQLTADPCTS